MKPHSSTFILPVTILAAMLGVVYFAEQGRDEIVLRVQTEVKRQGCTSADQSYYSPNIFYLKCPDGIREFDING